MREKDERSLTTGRRAVLASAWLTPIIAAATSAPLAAASTTPDSPGLVDYLDVTVQEITESAEGGLAWSSATMLYAWASDGPDDISFTWSADLTYSAGDDTSTIRIGTGAGTVSMTGTAELDPDEDQVVAPPVPAGSYTVTVTVTASDGSVRTFSGRTYIVSEANG